MGVAESNDNDGDAKDRHDTITWQPTDVITGLQLWKNRVGDALGRIVLTTNGTAKLDVRDVNWDTNSGVQVPLDSGILIGASGLTSSMVNSISWMFLKSRPVSATMVSVTYEDLETWNKMQR